MVQNVYQSALMDVHRAQLNQWFKLLWKIVESARRHAMVLFWCRCPENPFTNSINFFFLLPYGHCTVRTAAYCKTYRTAYDDELCVAVLRTIAGQLFRRRIISIQKTNSEIDTSNQQTSRMDENVKLASTVYSSTTISTAYVSGHIVRHCMAVLIISLNAFNASMNCGHVYAISIWHHNTIHNTRPFIWLADGLPHIEQAAGAHTRTHRVYGWLPTRIY